MSRKRAFHPTFAPSAYESDNGFLTTVWGPPLWHVLHTMSFNFPLSPTAADKQHYRGFIEALQFVLPCGVCRANFQRNLREHPPLTHHFESRNAFSRYIHRLHNIVNAMTGKPKPYPSFEEIRDKYEHLRARCAKPTSEHPHLGCTEPIYEGEKAKCVVMILPESDRTSKETIVLDDRCRKHEVFSTTQSETQQDVHQESHKRRRQ